MGNREKAMNFLSAINPNLRLRQINQDKILTFVDLQGILCPLVASDQTSSSCHQYIRPEFMRNYSKDRELADGFTYFTWKNPQNCSECGNIILEYEYYEYKVSCAF